MHEVDIGVAYRNDVSARTFVHYIAQSQRQNFLQSFSEKNTSLVSYWMEQRILITCRMN